MIQRRLDKSSRGMWDFCHLYNMLIEATSYSSVRWLIEKSKRKTHVRWCFFKQVTRSRSHILLSWETEEVMIQFPSGLFLRRAMILIRGGSDYVSIVEQQSSVDLERDNMFEHFHGALMLSAWPLHFAQKWDQSHCSLSLLPLSWLCPRLHTSQC